VSGLRNVLVFAMSLKIRTIRNVHEPGA